MKRQRESLARGSPTRGFTLIELTIAIFIGILFILSILGAFLSYINAVQKGGNLSIGSTLAENILGETIQSVRFENLVSIGETNYFHLLNNTNYFYNIDVQDIGSNMKKATIFIKWTFKGREEKVSLSTIVHKDYYKRE